MMCFPLIVHRETPMRGRGQDTGEKSREDEDTLYINALGEMRTGVICCCLLSQGWDSNSVLVGDFHQGLSCPSPSSLLLSLLHGFVLQPQHSLPA